MTSNRSRILRRCLLLSLTTLATSSGCASLQSPSSWFSKNPQAAAQSTGGVTGIAETGKGISGQFKSMGAAVGSAVTKTKHAFISTFSTDPTAKDDPTSLASMPTNLGPEIWVTNGQLYESQGNYAKAMENYQQALGVEPNNTSAMLSKARLHARQRQFAEAEQSFVQANAIQPSAAVLSELAQAQQQQGKSAEAQATLTQAIQMDPSNARYRNNLASLLVASGRSDEAVQQLQQVFPPAVASYHVAYLHFSNQDMAGAQQHLQVALQHDPNLKPARELMERMAGSQTAQSAMAAYQTAGQIYRTAEALTGANPPANPAVYSQTPPVAGGYGTTAGYGTAGFGTAPQQQPGAISPAQ